MADEDEAVRVAAVRAMARLGDVSLVERLAGMATAAGAVQQAARESLVRLAGADVEAKASRHGGRGRRDPCGSRCSASWRPGEPKGPGPCC